MFIKMTNKTRRIVGIITFLIIIAIIAADLFMYFTRKGLYTFKAKPAPSTATVKGFLGIKATPPNNVYYPNGEPDANTGVPLNSLPIPTGVRTNLQNKLNTYGASSTLQGPAEWGPYNGA